MIIKIEQTLCVTGHRPNKLPWGYNENINNTQFKKFTARLKTIIIGQIEQGYTNFITGMALGVDQIFANIVIELKPYFKNIKLIAAIPCKNQSSVWPSLRQEAYNKILADCDEKIVLSETYTPTCMNDRNRWMIEHSSKVIACWNGTAGGTGNAVQLAKDANLEIIRINPNDYKN